MMSSTDRRAIIACDIDDEPCGPMFCSVCMELTCTVDLMHTWPDGSRWHRINLVSRQCNENDRCPHHGGMGMRDENGDDRPDWWTAADQRELDDWKRRTA